MNFECRQPGWYRLQNPLYSAIIATSLAPDIEMKDVANRFFDVCRGLERLETVRALCILGHGTLVWGYRDSEIKPALFMNTDLSLPIIPVFLGSERTGDSLYHLMQNMQLHLYHSILKPEDLAVHYGGGNNHILIPKNAEHQIPPDATWIDMFKSPCEH